MHFDGQDDFDGEILHTARWPQDVDLAGRRVAVIGTGASSMQLVPTIADEVAALRVFQRSPQWVRPIPEYGRPVDPAAQWLFENLPHYAKWYRFGEFWRYGDGLLRHLRIDPEWEHPERSLNRTNDKHRREMTEYICAELADRPDLVEHCVPSYPPFGKRILLDNGWFSTLCRDHVELVTSSIERIESRGIRTADGRMHEADVIVLATGFTITDLVGKIEVSGRAGRRLADDWADDDPTAYLGMAVPGFPNFFAMYGPNTNMGHGGSGIFPRRGAGPLHLGDDRRDGREGRGRRLPGGSPHGLHRRDRPAPRGSHLEPPRHDDVLPEPRRPGALTDAVPARGVLRAHEVARSR